MILKRYTLATLAPLTLIEYFQKCWRSPKERTKSKIFSFGEGKHIEFSRIFFFEMKISKLINYLINMCWSFQSITIHLQEITQEDKTKWAQLFKLKQKRRRVCKPHKEQHQCLTTPPRRLVWSSSDPPNKSQIAQLYMHPKTPSPMCWFHPSLIN
jgi:hypothetical protein